MNKNLKVSVCMITYGHEKYIEQAINGVLMQITDFEVELIVANDCSTDKTDDIIQNIIQNHPRASWIKYTKHDKNLGMMPNFIWALQQCQGKYIALCEGDDYWTDPLKLQKQVDFLEANLDYNICFHRVQLIHQEENQIGEDTITRYVPETIDSDELAKGNCMHTPSVLLRNNFIIPNWFKKVPTGDWVLYMIALKDKKIKKIEEVMAVYRVNNNGVWSGKTRGQRMRMTIKSFKLVYKNVQLCANARENLHVEIAKLEKVIERNKKDTLGLNTRIKSSIKRVFKLLYKSINNN
ncbi:MAG TPA: glycosyltransferase [Lutibacter sp.]